MQIYSPTIVDCPAIDWLTFTSYEEQAKETVFSAIRSVGNGAVREGRWLQYSGERGDDYFIGGGQNGSSHHYAAWISGSAANDAARLLRSMMEGRDHPMPRCTRLDVQVTVERRDRRKPNLLSLAVALRRLLGAEWPRGARPGITFWSSETGDTLYLGNRRSDWMARIYDKPIDDRAYIRLEHEYKSMRARSAWTSYLEEGDRALGSMFAAEWAALPIVAQTALEMFREIAEGHAPMRPRAVREKPDMERRLDWLRGLGIALEELLRDDAHGMEAERILMDCIRRANRLE